MGENPRAQRFVHRQLSQGMLRGLGAKMTRRRSELWRDKPAAAQSYGEAGGFE